MCNGPFYHGTSLENKNKILDEGFSWAEEESRSGQTSHGYEKQIYYDTQCMAPVHHLGYGIYLTSSKTIAKNFGYGSTKNILDIYILKSAKIGTINFASPKKMMQWWIENGYDCDLSKKDRVEATKLLTQTLSSKYDAVYYKGRGLYNLLDGNQLCVYNPDILRLVDYSLSRSGEIGSKVKSKDGRIGRILRIRPLEEEFRKYHNNETSLLAVKWNRGGSDLNVQPSNVEFL